MNFKQQLFFSKHRYILPAIAGLLLSGNGIAQSRLQEIEYQLSKRGTAITGQIGTTVITNESELYKKISERSFVNYTQKISYTNDTLSSPVIHYKCRFKDSIIFNNVRFKSAIDFSLARCAGPISFHQSELEGKAVFSWAQFHSIAVFSRSKFRGEAVFQHAIFKSSCDFFQSHFYSFADFYGSQFNGNSNFGNTSFRNETDFSFIELNADCTFKNADFFKSCLFNNSEINSTLDFSGARFDSIASFSGCSVKGTLVFNNVTLPQLLDLSEMESIANVIDLTQIKSNGKSDGYCYINLINTDISKIKLRYENFRLWFPGNTGYETKCKVYEELLGSLNAFGFKGSYEKVDIEYQQLKYEHKNQFIKNKFQQVWWNYGYSKEAIFVWLFWIVLLLTLINTMFIRSLMSSIYEMKYLNHAKIVERYRLHHPCLAFFLNIPTGFLYTVILLAGGAFGIKFNSDQIRFPNFVGMLYIVSIGLLGISCSAFIVKFIFDL